jgi:predicted small lipoprotein YifL
MRNIIKLAVVLGVTVTLAACGGNEPEDDVVFVPPVQQEPVTGKF